MYHVNYSSDDFTPLGNGGNNIYTKNLNILEITGFELDFGEISLMLKYMTLGQNQKYSQDGSRLLNRAGKVVYDEKTQECFE